VNDDDEIALHDSINERVRRYDGRGKLLEGRVALSLSDDDRRDYVEVRSKDGYTYRIDPDGSMVRKRDRAGNEVLTFGPYFNLKRAVALALRQKGNLYVFDRGARRILKFGLPGPGVQTEYISLVERAAAMGDDRTPSLRRSQIRPLPGTTCLCSRTRRATASFPRCMPRWEWPTG